MSNTHNFGKIRSILWPIHSSELAKFIPMLIVFFLITFNYNILRAAKDSLIVTAPASGAEAIPFIKVWAILPMAFVMTFIFTKLSNKYSIEQVFYWMMGIFLGFFALFTFVLYPLRESLQPVAFTNYLQQILPLGCKGFIAMVSNWTLTAFYVMAELWGTIILTVLFWGFANEVTTVSEAKRFYSFLGVGANISGILSGQAAITLSCNGFFNFIPYGKNAWEQSVLFMNITILISGFVILIIFRYLNKQSVSASSNSEATISQVKTPKEKISLKKSFAYLAKSKYLICLALIVLSYNLTTHIIEVVWKNQIKQLYPNPSDFNAYMGHVMRMIGIVATIFALFLTGSFLRKFSWTFSALFTPVIVLVTGVFFFLFFTVNESISMRMAEIFGSTPLILSVFFGTLQNTLSRASKYTLFDSTKEIAYIPLSKESKRKGKAAIDGVGSRFGKSSGSALTQGLLIIFSTLTACAPYIAIIFLVILTVWIISVLALGKKFNGLIDQDDKIKIDQETIPALEPTLETNSSNPPINQEKIKEYFPFNMTKKDDHVKK